MLSPLSVLFLKRRRGGGKSSLVTYLGGQSGTESAAVDDALAHELERRFGAGELVGRGGADHDGEGSLFRAVDA